MTHTGEEKRKHRLIPQAKREVERGSGASAWIAQLGLEKRWVSAEAAGALMNEVKKSPAPNLDHSWFAVPVVQASGHGVTSPAPQWVSLSMTTLVGRFGKGAWDLSAHLSGGNSRASRCYTIERALGVRRVDMWA